jgi:hypothetical protein
MPYEEALEATVSAQEARDEIKAHGLDFEDFADEVGWREEYEGAEVLAWIGY